MYTYITGPQAPEIKPIPANVSATPTSWDVETVAGDEPERPRRMRPEPTRARSA